MYRLMVSFLVILSGTTLRAADWPQWLGPNRDGTSPEVVKPWKGSPKVVWRTSVGEGHSSPIVANGVVYLFDKTPNQDTERLTAWKADTGERIGSIEEARGPFSSPFGVGPRSTPIITGDVIYTLGVTGRLAAYRLPLALKSTRQEAQVFAKEVLKEFKAANLTFGVSATPLVEGSLAIVPAGGKGAGVVAFDRADGSVVWKALDDAASYASPIAIGPVKNRQIICLTQRGLVSLAPANGAVFWRFPFRDLLSESSTTPIKVGDLLIASSVTLGSVALRLGEKDGKPDVNLVWRKPELSCYFSTPVSVKQDHLYMVNGVLGLKPSVTLRCVDTATGKTLWQKPNIGKYHAALVRTGDDRLIMLDDGGHMTLIDPDPNEYRELSRSKVCAETWAHPALANGRLYVRDDKELICLQVGE